jgi:hypothetical protein
MSSNLEKAKRIYAQRVRKIVAQYPNGATIYEICKRYKELYPDCVRDVSGIVCSQERFLNFKKNGQDSEGRDLYVVYIPTKFEKLKHLEEKAERQLRQAMKTYEMAKEKRKQHERGLSVSTESMFDLDEANSR